MKIPALALTILHAAGLCGCVTGPQRAAQIEDTAAARSLLRGRPAPDFTLPDQDNTPVHLAALWGKWVVLYSYPEDGTPGCTCQAREFNRSHRRFAELSAAVFGVSPDPVARHREIADTYELRVRLLADPHRDTMRAYGAWVDTPAGGRVIRSTMLINPAGNIAFHWPEVLPEGHAERVQHRLEELQRLAHVQVS